MKVLVIGGSGYIGGHTVEELVGRGHEVSVFARGHTRPRLLEDVRFIKGDRHNPDDLSELRSHGFEAVIDINAYTREETQAAISTFDGRVSRFVHLSTASVYQITGNMPLVESDPLVTDPGATYAYNKAECERALRWAYTKNGFPFVSVRPGVVFGPRDNKSRENYYLKRIISGDPVIVADSGALPIFAVYVKDLAVSLANALTATGAEGNAYHLMQSEIVAIHAHIANIARLAGADAEVTEVPSRLLERVGFNLRQIPYHANGRLILCDTSAARADLAFSPTPYPRALKDTITYFLEHDPENHPSIEDRFPPVLPRSRERALTERFRAGIRALEDNLTDDWLDEAITGLSER
ncbi:MAG TPA: NAD-dependent epimerase/dehydratase family protein [Blastocatellia bacterium]|nr:NAD-dependent epimerase/dehydratase family protein [Blastocatellia bacterium]